MHSLTAERMEVVRDLDHFAATEVRPGTRPPRRAGPKKRQPKACLVNASRR